MFDKLREKWRKSREYNARKKAIYDAVSNGYPADVDAALAAQPASQMPDAALGWIMKLAIDRQDPTVFKSVLGWIENPNVTISYTVGSGNSSRSYKYAPMTYALTKARAQDVSMMLASDPRTELRDTHLDAAREGGFHAIAAVMARRIAETRRQEANALDREAAKVQGAPDAQKQEGAEPDAVDITFAPGESWGLMSKTSVAHVTTSEAIGRKMTEIFNFHSRERVLITENLKTGAESIGAAEPFDRLSPETVKQAEKILAQLNGDVGRKSFTL